MAIGDAAAAAGMALTPGSAPANTIETEINQSRDYIAQRTTRAWLDIYAQTAEPPLPRKIGRLWIHPES